MKWIALPVVAALASSAGWAADAPAVAGPISVLTPIGYSPEAPVKTWVRQDCNIEKHLATDLGDALAEKNLGGAPTRSAAEGRILKVSIERVIGASGGGWSGDKTLSIRVTLLKDGQVERTTDQTVATKSLNPLAGTCASFERASSKLSKLALRWLVPDPARGGAALAPPEASPASATGS